MRTGHSDAELEKRTFLRGLNKTYPYDFFRLPRMTCTGRGWRTNRLIILTIVEQRSAPAEK